MGELTFAATAAAEAALRTIVAGLGFVDGQRAIIEFLAVELRLRGVGLLLPTHGHKRETTRPIRANNANIIKIHFSTLCHNNFASTATVVCPMNQAAHLREFWD